MISQLFILSPRGDTIIKKEFRYDVPKVAPEVFFRTVKFWKDGEKAPAVFNEDGVNYLHIKVRPLQNNIKNKTSCCVGTPSPPPPSFLIYPPTQKKQKQKHAPL